MSAAAAEHQPWRPEDVLTLDQLADRLQITPRTVYGMSDRPRLRVGREDRYLWGEFLDYLRERAGRSQRRPAAQPQAAGGTYGLVREARARATGGA